MPKTLIIAEKPSVATDLARVLGKVPKNGDFFENDDLVIAAAVGHIVELFMPDEYDKKYKAWLLGSLPIIPEKFQLKPIESNKKKFNDLKRLMKRKDVGEIVNACDAGREGELIFRYIYDLAGVKKPIRRLWMVSMTANGIRQAWENLRAGEELEPLAQAARCRSEADWLVGINGTRAFTTRMFGRRGKQVATVGRVQTPTLAMVVERENEIRAFKPRTYWRVLADFGLSAGEYTGIYQKPGFKKGEDEHDRADRLWSQEEAEKIVAAAKDAGKGEVHDEKKRTRQSSPRLYDLTTLQREANGRFGLPAGKTLRIAQALYERHKVLTYPRTDSRALPDDYPSTVSDTLRKLSGSYREHADKVIENGWVNPKDKRVFDSRKVSDHFAIIPTGETKKLSEDEQKIYDMVTRRFIAVFFPPAEFDETTRITTAGEHSFKTTGKVMVVPGWLAVYGKTPADSEIPPLCSEDGSPAIATLQEAASEEDQTRPPPRYTEATLLSAMEGAGKLVEEEELAEAMKEKGIGTPATRASIIDHLIRETYLERQGRELAPTAKAEDLMRFLGAVKAEALTSPAMTGDWEHRLNQVARGDMPAEDFMDGIVDLTKQIVERTQTFEEDQANMDAMPFKSPTDGRPMLDSLRSYISQDGEFTIYKTISGRKIAPEEAQELAEKGKIGPLDDFRSKAGKPFSGILKIEENRVKFDFGNDNGEDLAELMKNLEQYEVIGSDPNSGGKVYETPGAYISEKYDPEEKKNPAFRMGRTMLSRTITREEVQKLLTERKTPLLEGLVSKRTGRPFKAFLLLKEDGKIAFEFPPRAAKKGARKAAKKTARKAAKKKS